MRSAFLAVDMGGTSVKYAVALEDDAWLAPPRERAARSDGGAAEIVGALEAVAKDAAAMAEAHGAALRTACVAAPGPFDFRAGVSLMTHKYLAIRGMPLAPVFGNVLPGVSVGFVHDAVAFLLGEAAEGAAVGAVRPAGVTLGTGFGFSLMRDGRALVGADLRPSVIVWNAPFAGGITEDFVSSRAIRARYAEKAGAADVPDVRALADMARAGNAAAREAFAVTGSALGRILAPRLEAHGCDTVVIGGQVANAADLFLPFARAETGVPLRAARHIADAGLRGALHFARRGGSCLAIVERSEGR